MIVVDVIVWVLIAIAVLAGALLALLLLMPISYRVRGAVDDEGLSAEECLWWHGGVRWAFGAVSLHAGPRTELMVRVFGVRVWRGSISGHNDDEMTEAKRDKRAAKKAKKDAKKAAKKHAKKRASYDSGQQWERLHVWLEILGRYAGALHLSGHAEGVIGMPYPDQTATVHQVLVTLDRTLPVDLSELEVDWIQESLFVEGQVRGWVWPLELVWVSLRVFLRADTRRAIRAA